jgi:hypothetical protein
MQEMNFRLGKHPGKMPDENFDICGLTNVKFVVRATKLKLVVA